MYRYQEIDVQIMRISYLNLYFPTWTKIFTLASVFSILDRILSLHPLVNSAPCTFSYSYFFILVIILFCNAKTYPDQALESQYFNWKCLICNQLAQSPSELEMQHMVEYSPCTDINGNKWIKCDKCFYPYHVECLKKYIPVGKCLWSFLACNQ